MLIDIDDPEHYGGMREAIEWAKRQRERKESIVPQPPARTKYAESSCWKT